MPPLSDERPVKRVKKPRPVGSGERRPAALVERIGGADVLHQVPGCEALTDNHGAHDLAESSAQAPRFETTRPPGTRVSQRSSAS